MPGEEIEKLEAIAEVKAIVRRLPEHKRNLIQMKYHDNLSYKEIVEATQISLGNVGYQSHHAFKKISAELRKTREGTLS